MGISRNEVKTACVTTSTAHVQVQQHAAEVRTAQQEASAAAQRATAAERDARAARGRLSALEDDAKSMRGQAQQEEKRRARDGRALKDVEARLAERDGQLDTANKTLAKVRFQSSSSQLVCSADFATSFAVLSQASARS